MKVTIEGHVIEGTPEEIKDYFELLGAELKPKDADEPCEDVKEEAPKFKEGDRVKALADGEYDDVSAGEVGKITDIIVDESFNIEVTTDDEYDYFRPQDLELVTEEIPWKKGDKVRNKETGEIVEVHAYKPKERTYGKNTGFTFGGHETGFTFINDSDFEYWEVIDKYEPVEETPSKLATIKRKARVGERILITDASEAQIGKPYKNGDILTVTEIGCCDLPLCGDYLSIFDYEYEVIDGEETQQRKPGEFKKGDIVRYLGGAYLKDTLVEVVSDSVLGKTRVIFENDLGICTERNEELELIAPVEARVDR